jgi:hypothetical protein
VDDDHVIGFEHGHQALFEMGKETRTADHQRRYNAVVAQASHEGDGLPVALRYMGDQSLTTLAAPAQPRHAGGNSGLVDEEPGRIKQTLLAHPASARRATSARYQTHTQRRSFIPRPTRGNHEWEGSMNTQRRDFLLWVTLAAATATPACFQ